MNKILTTLFLLCFSIATYSQEISGNWMGEIDINGNKLGFTFAITKTEKGYESTMDIPTQGLKGAKAENTTFTNAQLFISFPEFQIKYEGKLNEKEEIEGNFIQGGHPIPLNLKRGTITLNRPQEPKPPFDYYSEEIIFKTSDNLKIEGTLTLPQKNGKFPIVTIISGSGPQDRDGEIFGHKPYLVLADHLTKNGIGVFRFDERGVGNSEGIFATATIETLTSDIESAIQYLQQRKDINISKFGLIGHSIGGIIAPKIASKNNDINFIVLMAAPGVNGDQLMLSQKAALERGLGLNEMQIAQGQELVKGAYDIIINSDLNSQQLKDSLNTFYINKYGVFLPQEQRESLVEQITGNEMIGLIRSKPSEYLKKIKCPLLAINGDKDFQVPSKENLKAIESSTKESGNKNVKTVELKNLNHLFQESKTGLLNEYAQIEQTISPTALELISTWIKEQTK